MQAQGFRDTDSESSICIIMSKRMCSIEKPEIWVKHDMCERSLALRAGSDVTSEENQMLWDILQQRDKTRLLVRVQWNDLMC